MDFYLEKKETEKNPSIFHWPHSKQSDESLSNWIKSNNATNTAFWRE